MAKTIAFVNQKGGVGKTTSCVNLAACLVRQGARVLVVDFDPQGNATSGFGVDKVAAFPTIYDVLIRGASVENAVVKTPYCDVIPANKTLAGASVELIGLDRREYLLKETLARVAGNYDFILIDCPPVDIVADTQIIDKSADMTIFLVRAGMLDKSMLPELEEAYKSSKYRNLAVILNGTEMVSGGRYGYRYGYKYGYHYGYYGGHGGYGYYGSDKDSKDENGGG